MAKRAVVFVLAALVVTTSAACGGDSKPRLEVSSDITAAIATAALGDDATVTVAPDGALVDDALLRDLAPIPYGHGPQWTSAPSDVAGAPVVGAPDPAIWLDPDRVVQAARSLAGRVRLDDDAQRRTDERIDALRTAMQRADEAVQAQLQARTGSEPPLTTTQIRLGYFALRYGVQIAPTTAPGRGSDDLDALDLERLGPAGSETATLDGLIVEVARRVAARAR